MCSIYLLKACVACLCSEVVQTARTKDSLKYKDVSPKKWAKPKGNINKKWAKPNLFNILAESACLCVSSRIDYIGGAPPPPGGGPPFSFL